VDDPELEVVLLRAQEISLYVEDGVFDCGITGKDWIEENNSKVHEVTEFVYAKSGLGKVRWVIAVPEQSKIRKIKDLAGKHIATEAVNMTKRFLKKHGIKADVEFSWGATEAKTPELVDAIVDVTETGSSLKANNLRIVDTIMESTTRFIANKESWKNPAKRRKMENLCMLLQGALNAEKKVGVKMNVRKRDLDKALGLIPSLRNPTISALTQKGWHAIEIVVDETVIRELIPRLKKAGAEGIIEFPLNKVIY
jgi:ATP phosphoribosyltransferase